MEEKLINVLEEKVQVLEAGKITRLAELAFEDNLNNRYTELKNSKKQAETEIEKNGPGKEEAISDLEKIDKEFEEVKALLKEKTKKVNSEISAVKRDLTRSKKIISERDKAQEELDKLDEEIEKLLKNKADAETEIEENGEGKEKAISDLEKIEKELEEKQSIKKENETTISKRQKSLDKLIEKYEIEKLFEEEKDSALDEDVWSDLFKEEKQNNIEEKQNNIEEKQNNIEENIVENNEDKKEDLGHVQIVIKNKDVNGYSGFENRNVKNLFSLNYRESFRNIEEKIFNYHIMEIDYNKRRNIDYSLISAFEKLPNGEDLVKNYLTLIQDKNNKEAKQKLMENLDIRYVFGNTIGNFKQKRLARFAHNELGIAGLQGISEKSIWQKIKEKFSTKKLSAAEDYKALPTGKDELIDLNTKNEEQKEEKSTRLQDRKDIVINNKDSHIEKQALEDINKGFEDIRKETQKEFDEIQAQLGKKVKEIRDNLEKDKNSVKERKNFEAQEIDNDSNIVNKETVKEMVNGYIDERVKQIYEEKLNGQNGEDR